MKEPEELFEIDDAETLEMLADPIRVELIERLIDPASVTEVAEAMGVIRTRLYHHVRLLEEAGLIRVVETRQRRAIPEKIYQSAAKRFQPSRRFLAEASPVEAVAAVVDSAFTVTRADITRSFAEGRAGFDDDESQRTMMLNRSVVKLSGERLHELVTELGALLDRYDDEDPGPDRCPGGVPSCCLPQLAAGAVRELLRIRDFRQLWMGQATSYFGDGLTNLTLLIVTQRLTGSVTAVAATAVAIALPQLIFGLMAGVYVDRWNRKTVMIISDLVRGILVLGFLLVDSADHMWWLYTLAFVQASVGTFFTPAKMAFVPAVVGPERLRAANSLGETTRVVAMMLGTAMAGVIAGGGDVLWIAFVIDGATFVTSALFELRIATDGQAPTHDKSRVWAELTTGLRMAISSRVIIGLMVAAAVLMLGLGAVNVLIVPFLIEDLGFSEAWFGPLEAAQVAGLVLAGSLMTILAQRARPRSVVSLGLAGLGASVAACALVTAPWHMLVALFMIGWFLAPVQASVTTLLQTEVADELRGRIGSMFSTVVTFTNVASMALAGAAAALLGIRGVFVLAGTVALLSAVLATILLRSAPVVPATSATSATVVRPRP